MFMSDCVVGLAVFDESVIWYLGLFYIFESIYYNAQSY
jgi:hypothetical protein